MRIRMTMGTSHHGALRARACRERKARWAWSLVAHWAKQRPKIGNDIDHDASGGLK